LKANQPVPTGDHETPQKEGIIIKDLGTSAMAQAIICVRGKDNERQAGISVIKSSAPAPTPPLLSPAIARDLVLLKQGKKKSQRKGRRKAPATSPGVPLSLVYSESNLFNKEEYMEAIQDTTALEASQASKEEARQVGGDLSFSGEISVPSLWKEKQPGETSFSSMLSTEPPRDLTELEASIRANHSLGLGPSPSVFPSAPGAYQVQVAPSAYCNLARGATRYSSAPPPELTPYVVEAQLVVEDPDEDEDQDDDENDDQGSSGRDDRYDAMEMAVIAAKPVVEATPVREPSVWRKRCAVGAAALMILLTAGAAVGITLTVTKHREPNLAPQNETKGEPAKDTAPSSNYSSETITTADPVGDFCSTLPKDTMDAIATEGSPQFLAYKWVHANPPVVGHIVSRLIQRFALATLYYATDGENWSNNKGWLDPSAHECDWHYDTDLEFSCYSGNDTITGIGLSSNELRGEIPPELALLSSLEVLLISMNAGLDGSIPDSVIGMKALSEVYMSQNALSGSLPYLDPIATHIFLWENRFSGSIPKSHANLTNVQTFIVRTNLLTGTFGEDIWGNWSQVKAIDVSENSLAGSISSRIGLLTNLESLGLMVNQFNGSLPTELGKLTAMNDMYLGGNAFSSTIPTEFGNLSNLKYLDLFSNGLNGTLPTHIGRLAALQELYLDSNDLSGSIPLEIAKLSYLQILSLFGNALTGTIPPQLLTLPELHKLDLSNNLLSGPIPRDIGNLPTVTEVHLHSNRLNGTLPTEVGMLASVVELSLDYNELTGTIPTELGSLKLLQKLDLRGNDLVGSIPVELCSLVSMKSLVVSVDCDKVACTCGCLCTTNSTERRLLTDAFIT
jgi:Leucine-rich repeat (LRR) protein